MKKYENLMLCACLCSCHLWPLFNVGLVSLIFVDPTAKIRLWILDWPMRS